MSTKNLTILARVCVGDRHGIVTRFAVVLWAWLFAVVLLLYHDRETFVDEGPVVGQDVDRNREDERNEDDDGDDDPQHQWPLG